MKNHLDKIWTGKPHVLTLWAYWFFGIILSTALIATILSFVCLVLPPNGISVGSFFDGFMITGYLLFFHVAAVFSLLFLCPIYLSSKRGPMLLRYLPTSILLLLLFYNAKFLIFLWTEADLGVF